MESNNGASNAGCTSNVLLYEKEKNILYCANTGDTRAVLCRHTSSINTPIAYDLTVDRFIDQNNCHLEILTLTNYFFFLNIGNLND